MEGFENEKWRVFVSMMLVLILVAIIGFGSFFVIRSFKSDFANKTNELKNAQMTTKPEESRLVKVSPETEDESSKKIVPMASGDVEYTIEWISGGNSELTGSKDDYIEIDFDATETTSGINEILYPKEPIKLKSKNLTGFRVTDDSFETDIFKANLPKDWEACNTGDCIYLYDKNHQPERLYLFTLRSVKMTKADYGSFLDKVFANHKKLRSYSINGNEYIYSFVSKGKYKIVTLLKPIDNDFGLMMQCHSSTGMLTASQKEIISTLKLKQIPETKPQQP